MNCPSCGRELQKDDVCERCGPDDRSGTTRARGEPQAGDSSASQDLFPRFSKLDTSSIEHVETLIPTDATIADRARPKSGQIFFPGARVAGRYRILELIGRGGMGEVYSAEDQKLNQVVALKFLPQTQESETQGWLKRFLDEVRIARQISHPNVCRVFDVAETVGRHFLSMEYVDGEDLATLLHRNGALPPELAVDVSIQICRGLAAIHECGILHRDLKPANLILDHDSRIRVADFGLATSVGSVRGADVMSGTPFYMAPEQHVGLEVTQRSDVYALGLVLYELFAGRAPFHGATIDATEIARRHRETAPPPISEFRPNVDPTIERIILRCLEKDPGRRPASADAVRVALEAEAALTAGEMLRTVVAAGGVDSLERFSDLLTEYGGREVSSEQPAWLFERPWAAVRFALDLHGCLQEEERRRIHLGVHFGELRLRRREYGDAIAAMWIAEGYAVDLARRLCELSRPGQILLSRQAFDFARRGAVEVTPDADLRWLAHGSYLFPEPEEVALEVCEVGLAGRAPLTPPEGTNEIPAVVDGETVFGWRPAPGLEIPQRPGWKIDRKIGEGGFSEIWLGQNADDEHRVFKFCWKASQLRALRKEIMLFQVLKEEFGERRDIARVLGWNLEEPPYYLEFEYSASGSLIDWARQEGGLPKVPLDLRLEIVAQVATALAAAHSVGVLHKDVKPGNVLIVSGEGGETQARLSDFGIGQLTERDRLVESGIFTGADWTEPMKSGASTGGTRLYTAPELLEGKRATLQSDIYALGVMLFQIVVGDFSRALATGWRDEIDDELLAEDIAFAVQGQPDSRLADAALLADRLRSLERRRVALEEQRRAVEEARRTHRHRRVLVAVIAVLAVFGGGTASMLWQVDTARREAEREATTASAVSGFLVDMFEANDPYSTDGDEIDGDTPAHEILSRGVERLSAELTDQPEIRARLLTTIGTVERRLGRFDSAEGLLREALDLYEASERTAPLERAQALSALGVVERQTNDYEIAQAYFQEALLLREKALGEDHLETAQARHDLARTLQWLGRFDEAETLFRQALDVKSKLLGEEDPDAVETLNALAYLLQVQGKNEEAEELFRRVLDVKRKILPADHPLLASALSDFGLLLSAQGKLREAEKYTAEALESLRRSVGPEHNNTMATLFNYARVLHALERWDDAEDAYREANLQAIRIFGDDSIYTAISAINLADLLNERDRLDEAEPLITEALETHRKILPDEHWRIAFAESVYGDHLRRRGRFDEAAEKLRRSRDVLREVKGEDSDYDRGAMRKLEALYADRPDFRPASDS